MRRWLIGSLAVAVIAGLLLRATLLAPESVSVRAVRVELGRVESTVTNTKAGTVRARRRAKLSSEMGGRVVELVRQESDRVERGEPIIRLGDASQRARLLLSQESLRAAEASQRRACVARDRARRELERKRQLAEQRIVSADLLDALESAYEAARASCNVVAAEVSKTRAQITVAEVELEKMIIRAPFGGIIAQIQVEVGEWVTPSVPLIQAPAVVDLIDPSSLYVSAPMDEVDSAAIRVGQRAKATVDSHPGEEFAGSVVRVAPYVLDIEAQNRTVEIEVEFDDKDFASSLLPGTSADVEVVLEVREAVLRLPTSALLEGSRILVASDGRLVEQSVETGLKNWDYVEIRKGLEVEQQVVVSLDREGVEAGARVEIEESE